MPLYVNTNVSSLNAQRQLINSGNQLDQAFERLSSGFRINSAADDAAGLQISNRLGSQIEGLNQGNRNANDGISVAQTAEGALQESSSILQRMRTLAIQSENGLNSSEDKAAIQKEIGVLQDELTRIAETTSFGGENLLDGAKTKTFQVGANANETISFDLQSTKASDIGSYSLNSADGDNFVTDAGSFTDGATDPIAANGDLTISSGGENYDVTVGSGSDMKTVASDINALNSGVTAEATNFAVIGPVTVNGVGSGVTINSQSVDFTSGDLDTIAKNINDVSDTSGVTAEVVDGNIQLTGVDGADINVQAAAGDGTDNVSFELSKADSDFTASSTDTATIDSSGGVDGAILKGDLELTSAAEFGVVGDGGETNTVDANLSSVQEINLENLGGGQDAIGVIDAAIAQIDSFRADLGAAQNRFQATVRNQANISENLSEAQSRIKDADFAAETAKLTQAQILQQASQTILAQANQRPQAALSLLG